MRVQWSEHEARAVLAAWRKSGVSIEKFAEQRGLVPQRIYWWKKKLEPTPKAVVAATAPLALLPVEVSKPALSRQRGEPVMVMLRSGHVLKVGRGFDDEAFARAIAILEGV